MNNSKVTPHRACHKPSHTNPWIQPVKGATSGNLPFASRNMLHSPHACAERDALLCGAEPPTPAPRSRIARRVARRRRNSDRHRRRACQTALWREATHPRAMVADHRPRGGVGGHPRFVQMQV